MILKRKQFSIIEDEKLFFLDSYGNAYKPDHPTMRSVSYARKMSENNSKKDLEKQILNSKSQVNAYLKDYKSTNNFIKRIDKDIADSHKSGLKRVRNLSQEEAGKVRSNLLRQKDDISSHLKKEASRIKILENSKRAGELSKGLYLAKRLK